MKKNNKYNKRTKNNRGQYFNLIHDMSKQCEIIKKQIAKNTKAFSFSQSDLEIYETILKYVEEIETFLTKGLESLQENNILKDVEALTYITNAYQCMGEMNDEEKKLSYHRIKN